MASPQPVALNEVMRLNADQTEAEEIERSLLMKGWDCEVSDAKDSISTGTSSGSVARDWNLRPRDQSVCPLQHPDCFYSVWVSYCEIYNEQAYDLLDVCDKRRKRVQLRVTEDRKGKFFVKGTWPFHSRQLLRNRLECWTYFYQSFLGLKDLLSRY